MYNEFKNVISQILKKTEVLTRDEFLKSFRYVVKHDAEEPDLSHAAQFFYEFYVNTIFYNALLNNIASEQSARMNAMENASKNAGEILTNLTLEYNKARQAKITMELCEIISGAAAVWSALMIIIRLSKHLNNVFIQFGHSLVCWLINYHPS